jgi:hypothetical protein
VFNINFSNKLEREFEIAKAQGRWLSDEERKDLHQHEAIRSKLTVLTGICVLLPPLWPFALGLTIYLLFPKKSSRLESSQLFFFLLSSLLLTSALIFLLWDLINAFF